MEKTPPTGNLRKKLMIAAAVVAALVCIWMGFKWLTEWQYHVETNDAYVQGDIAAIAPKVSGYVQDGPAAVNTPVKKGDVLFRLEAGDYEIALQQAIAKLETQKSTLERIDAQIDASQASLDEAVAQKDSAVAVATNARSTLNRAEQLNRDHYVSQSEVDKAQSGLDQAVAGVARATAQIATVKANVSVLRAQRKEAATQTRNLELMQNKAQRDLDYTTLNAPFDGIIGNIVAKKGDLVVSGQRIAALVPSHELYIDANYKETQLSSIYAGQTAYITIDSLKNKTFTGKVISIAPATGSVFSLLPPQNATGNFTKVVQRIPVRIAIPKDALEQERIFPGMSAAVNIDTRTQPDNAKPLHQN